MKKKYLHLHIMKIALLLLLPLSFSACKTANGVSYFNNIETMRSGQIGKSSVDNSLRIQPSDQLSIIVSAVDPSSVAAFNLPLVSRQSASSSDVNTVASIQSYTVDSDGCIEFPVLGRIEVAGLTLHDLSARIKERLSSYVKSPVVNIHLLNFKVSVLGEVNNPGMKYASDERISVLDALAMAGDMTIYGKRDNVLVIRDNGGEKEFARLDLNSTDIMASDYYYMRQNDVVYVEPNDFAKKNSQYSQTSQHRISVASVIISTLSVIASLGIAFILK